MTLALDRTLVLDSHEASLGTQIRRVRLEDIRRHKSERPSEQGIDGQSETLSFGSQSHRADFVDQSVRRTPSRQLLRRDGQVDDDSKSLLHRTTSTQLPQFHRTDSINSPIHRMTHSSRIQVLR